MVRSNQRLLAEMRNFLDEIFLSIRSLERNQSTMQHQLLEIDEKLQKQEEQINSFSADKLAQAIDQAQKEDGAKIEQLSRELAKLSVNENDNTETLQQSIEQIKAVQRPVGHPVNPNFRIITGSKASYSWAIPSKDDKGKKTDETDS